MVARFQAGLEIGEDEEAFSSVQTENFVSHDLCITVSSYVQNREKHHMPLLMHIDP